MMLRSWHRLATPRGMVLGALLLVLAAVFPIAAAGASAASGPKLAQSLSSPAWHGEYFNGTDMSGKPSLVRDDADINFNWGAGSPDRRIAPDDFSVRWTRAISFGGGGYSFCVTAKDGVRLWLDEKLLIDQWQDTATLASYQQVGELVGQGTHTIKLEYYNHTGDAVVTLSASPSGAPSDTGGWSETFYNNVTLSEPAVAFRFVGSEDGGFVQNWESNSPASGVNADDFSARLVRKPWWSSPGEYTFKIVANDGVRLWVNGQLLIDEWHDVKSGARQYASKPVNLWTTYVDFKVEYYDRNGEAQVSLSWTRDPGSKQTTR